ncbi:tetratricopeptide repeat protein [Pleionea sp. CnH1-48]|uniref:tetratricopeptide repeat protein n=1 Tax=Pleionea sp. CnH1-48 TaxID=2954494 RepID=UPI0020977E67|nr:tetratricopeptide repeat protein [Pleionea sp. CnH1-48]MCO7224736.1 tetratricopeptide repeat protein [Pleionea sp. CnH1-48]
MNEQEFLAIKSKTEQALEKDDHSKAIELMEQMQSINPTYFEGRDDLYLRMGELYSKNNNLEKAEECFQQAYNIAPSDISTGTFLLTFLVKFERAESHRSLVAELEKLEADMYLSMAIASYYHHVGDKAMMWQHLENAAEAGAMDIDLMEYEVMNKDIQSEDRYEELFD